MYHIRKPITAEVQYPCSRWIFLRVNHRIRWSETVRNLIVTCFHSVIHYLNIFTINQWMHKTKIRFENTCIKMYVFINIPRAYSKFIWPGECYISDWSWTAMWPSLPVVAVTISMCYDLHTINSINAYMHVVWSIHFVYKYMCMKLNRGRL